MIWSIIPQEMIFAEQNQYSFSQIEYKGIQLLVDNRDLPAGKFRIIRLLSSSPESYLCSELNPGEIIDMLNE